MFSVFCGQCFRRSQHWKKIVLGISILLGIYLLFIIAFRFSMVPDSWIQKIILSKKRQQFWPTNYQYSSKGQHEEEYEGYEDGRAANGMMPDPSYGNYSVEAGEFEGRAYYDSMQTDFPPPKHPPPPPPPPPPPRGGGPLKTGPYSKSEFDKENRGRVGRQGNPTSPKLDRREFNAEQRNRKLLLREQCEKLAQRGASPHKNTASQTLSHMMLMDHRHKLLFCFIPKVGCTFFKRLMTILNGKFPNAVDPYSVSANSIHILRMDYLPEAPKRRNQVLESYQKMLFVRDPYARLFSGYLDKMFMARPSSFKLSSYIIKNFRPNSTPQDRKCPINVNFEELIRYVLHSNSHNQNSNYHFQPMNSLCNVCGLDYDVIGKLETFTNDVYFAMEKINQTARLPSGDFRLERMEDELRTVVNYAYQVKNNTCMSFGERLRRLWRRAQIRGFLSLDLKFPLTDAEALTITNHEFLDLITDAHFKSRDDPMLQANKMDAMIQLYREVPMELLNKLQTFFEKDCILFGYDPKPDIVFRRDLLRSSPFKYFDLNKVK